MVTAFWWRTLEPGFRLDVENPTKHCVKPTALQHWSGGVEAGWTPRSSDVPRAVPQQVCGVCAHCAAGKPVSVGGLLPRGAGFDLRVLGGRFVSFGVHTNARIQSFTAECCYKCYSFQLSLVVVADGGDGSPTGLSYISVCLPLFQVHRDRKTLGHRVAAAGAPSELLRTTWPRKKRQEAPYSAKITYRTTSAAFRNHSREGETQAFYFAELGRKHDKTLCGKTL